MFKYSDVRSSADADMLFQLNGSITDNPLYIIGAALRNSESILDEKTIIDSLLLCRVIHKFKRGLDYEIKGKWLEIWKNNTVDY